MRSSGPGSQRPARATRTAALTVLALTFFAANSLLCRAALGDARMDAASFTLIRLASGAAMLWGLVRLTSKREPADPASPRPGGWPAAFALAAYAVLFSFAYLQLRAGVGALLLFGAVQATMITAAVRQGEPFPPLRWIGVAIAMVGFGALTWPSDTEPWRVKDAIGVALMLGAGVAWGVYSLLGRGRTRPVEATANNFLKSVALGAAVWLVAAPWMRVNWTGTLYASASGALTSGLGYVVWYAALRDLSSTTAALSQLAVPVIVAVGGVFWLGETWNLKLAAAAAAVLTGIALNQIASASSRHRGG